MANFNYYGSYYGNDTLDTGQLLKLEDPSSPSTLINYISWGYTSSRTAPGAGIWIPTDNLYNSPYSVPGSATAVRLHIKAKAKTITWTSVNVIGDLQIGVRPYGSSIAINEVAHATAAQIGGTGQPDEQIAHVPVDVPVNSSGKLELFAYPTVVNTYADIEVAVFLAGYWA